MSYYFTDPVLGSPNITSITSVASAAIINGTQLPVGTIRRGADPTLGGGEFIYLPGVASNIVGSVVTYNLSANTVALTPNTTTYGGAPVAVSMAANTSTTALSWYQIEGAATVAKTATKINPNVALYISSAAGKVQSTLATGLQIEAARSSNTATVASATGTVLVTLNRPSMEGSKT